MLLLLVSTCNSQKFAPNVEANVGANLHVGATGWSSSGEDFSSARLDALVILVDSAGTRLPQTFPG